jgi:Ca2+:H+ antiporter
VLPTFTTSVPGPEFNTVQLTFAALASAVIYGVFVVTQTGRHRDFFLPVEVPEAPDDADAHAEPPSGRAAVASLMLLLLSLVVVVGLAKVESPFIEDAVRSAGLPQAVVGVVIALLVLLPESLAAYRAASRNRTQVSINLAFGSAMASIGLTIPVIAIASIWLDGPLLLGLGPTQLVLFALTMVVGALTVVPGRATRLQGAVHLAILAAFLVISASP